MAAISLMLAVPDAGAASAWYQRALGATELWNLGSVIGLEIDGAPFFLAEPANNGWQSPAAIGTTTARVEVFVDDPDSFAAGAAAAGANYHDPVRNHEMPWGTHRQGGFFDPYGHLWLVGDRSPLQSDARMRAAIEEHWRASDAGETDAEHAIYADDAILDYPQSGERYRGRAAIKAQRGGHPANRRFTLQRISGGGDLWVSECIITYDGTPTYSVSIMRIAGAHVTHETQYFADPFSAPAWRADLAEPMPGRQISRA